MALGTFTFVATLVHPMKAAEQFSVIDNLSRGRLVHHGLARLPAGFWGQFGIPQEKLLGRFLEALKIWRAAFQGERFDFEGEHWQVRDGLLAPRPSRRAAGRSGAAATPAPAAIRRSASYGECWTCDPLPLTEDVGTSMRASTASAPRSSARRRSSC